MGSFVLFDLAGGLWYIVENRPPPAGQVRYGWEPQGLGGPVALFCLCRLACRPALDNHTILWYDSVRKAGAF